jgi:microcystin-dependent protein
MMRRVCVAPNPADEINPDGLVVPSGLITYWGSATPPEDWLLCNGAAVSRIDFADLFSLFGTAFGNGNGTTTFNMPNLNGRLVRALGQATAPAPNVGFIGATGGADSVSFTIAAANLPKHRHGVLVPGNAMANGTNAGGFPNVDTTPISTKTIAGETYGEADNAPVVANSAISLGITNQYLGLNFIIKT